MASKYTPVPPYIIIDLASPNFSRPANPRRILYFIIHATGGTLTSAINTFKNPKEKVSAHYVLGKEGKLFRMVNEPNIAWHAAPGMWKGDTAINTHSVGIELENSNNGKDPYPDIQLKTLMYQCLDVCRRHAIGYERVLRHSDVATGPNRKYHLDPGDAFPWVGFISELTENLK